MSHFLKYVFDAIDWWAFRGLPCLWLCDSWGSSAGWWWRCYHYSGFKSSLGFCSPWAWWVFSSKTLVFSGDFKLVIGADVRLVKPVSNAVHILKDILYFYIKVENISVCAYTTYCPLSVAAALAGLGKEFFPRDYLRICSMLILSLYKLIGAALQKSPSSSWGPLGKMKCPPLP